MPAEQRPSLLVRFRRRRGAVIGDEPGNTIKDPDASEKAVFEGQGRADLSLLSALRQDLPRGHSCFFLRTGEVQLGRARSRRADFPEDGVTGLVEVSDRLQVLAARLTVQITRTATDYDTDTVTS